jgi:hypothetical protein
MSWIHFVFVYVSYSHISDNEYFYDIVRVLKNNGIGNE